SRLTWTTSGSPSPSPRTSPAPASSPARPSPSLAQAPTKGFRFSRPVGNRPRVGHVERGPAHRPETRQGAGELMEMQAVVRHPARQEIEPGEPSPIRALGAGGEPLG